MDVINVSGGLDNDCDVPDLADSPTDTEDEDEKLGKKLGKISGGLPWDDEPQTQTKFCLQSERWERYIEMEVNTFNAIERIIYSPFLFQTLLIPEKWIRWASLKKIINFDFKIRKLPSGAISREHYLVTRLLQVGIKRIQRLAEKRKNVKAILKMMHSIRNIPSTEVDRALNETKQNELMKVVVDFIYSIIQDYPDYDKVFFKVVDRVVLIALLCFRQFAETVHIVACEARNIYREVAHHYSEKYYYLSEISEEGRKNGNEFYKKGKFDEAFEEYTYAIDRAPFHYLLYSNRCQVAIRKEDYQSGYVDAYRCLILNPEWSKGYLKIAICIYELGHIQEAMVWAHAGLIKCKKDDAEIQKNLNILLEKMKSETLETHDKGVGMEVNRSEIRKEKFSKPKKKGKKKRKPFQKEADEDDVPVLVSDDEFEECPVIADTKKSEEKKKIEEERRQLLLSREKKERKEKEVQKEFESYMEKATFYFLKDCYRDACKSYSLAIDFVEKHKEIRGCNDNDVATLLYSRGMSSQRQGTPLDINTSRKYFGRIITEHKAFSHTCMVQFADAKSIYLLNDFDIALKEGTVALKTLNKFPVNGLLSWPGTTEYIPESNERFLRREICLLLKQCKVPPIPTAICQYEACLKDYQRKSIYVNDLDFEGYFAISCDWSCKLSYHLRCWSKFKHQVLRVSGDKDVLGSDCYTPDCHGKIILIKMFDENAAYKKDLKLPNESRGKENKIQGTKYDRRTSKSEFNLRKYREAETAKKKKRRAYRKSDDTNLHNIKQSTKNKIRQSFSNVHIPADKDLTDAKVYVKNTGADNSQKVQASRNRNRNNKRMGPVSLQQFCSSLPGYRRHMSIEEIIEAIDKAKVECTSFFLPDDLREEIDQFEHSLSHNDENVHFTDDEKYKMPFLFEYFQDFFTVKGPLDTNDELFSSQLIILPQDMKQIVNKCGGLIAFLNSSPLFIQIPPYIGVHSHHAQLRKLTGDYVEHTDRGSCSSSIIDHDFTTDLDAIGLSQFAQEFYMGALAEESDIINLIGGSDNSSLDNKLDQFNGNDSPHMKRSQNSETSSMYSLEDLSEQRSETGSQASCDIDKQIFKQSVVSMKSTKHIPQSRETNNVGTGMMKKQGKKKFVVTTAEAGTQTEGRDEAEKAKEAVARLQERLEEMQDSLTKLKITSQTREESLLKQMEEVTEREKIALQEKQNMKQYADSELAKVSSLKKQSQDKVQAAESRAEQSQAKEREAQMNLSRLMEGMQKDREDHMKEILKLRQRVENQEKGDTDSKQRAIKAEVDLMKTKEAYHVTAHMQVKSHCEHAVREFDIEISRLAVTMPEHILQHFRLAQKQWAANAITCGKTIETLKAAYTSIIDQITAGRCLSELPPVPDLKPPAPCPTPRQLMMQLHRNNLANAANKTNGAVNASVDGQSATGFTTIPAKNGAKNKPVGIVSVSANSPSPMSSSSSKNSSIQSQSASRSPAAMTPIGLEMTKAPKRNNFQTLLEKLSNNIPQLTKEQIERYAQKIRADNKGLTGFYYEEIEQKIKMMAGVSNIGQPASSSQSHSSPSLAMWNMSSLPLGYKREDFETLDIEEEESMCPICCDPLKDGKVSTLECQHKFHHDCINKWMKKQRTCPNCRKFMADTTEFPALGQNGVQVPPGLLPG
ncbi:uncharacterized protein LOC120327250 [Styela clava]